MLEVGVEPAEEQLVAAMAALPMILSVEQLLLLPAEPQPLSSCNCKKSQKSAVVGGGDGESGVRQLLDGDDGLASASASDIDAAPPLQSR